MQALIAEIKKTGPCALKTIYFGGGTPSMLDEKSFDAIMEALKNNFVFQQGLEIAIETNPESISAKKAALWRALGFNRVSLGVQSLDERYLKFLGRAHDKQKAMAAYHALREAGFNNINLDLMYGFPGQSDDEVEADVRSIAAMGSEHLSLYTLTIEANSRFYARQMKLDDPEKQAQQYLLIARVLKEYGFAQYEVSNFAKPGFESVHNKNYWLGGTYIGLGVGAHGFNGRRRYWNTSNFQEYIQKASSGASTQEGFEDLTEAQLIMERVLFGLRMNEGIPLSLIPHEKMALIRSWAKDGLVVLHDDRMMVSDQGRLLLDELAVRLI